MQIYLKCGIAIESLTKFIRKNNEAKTDGRSTELLKRWDHLRRHIYFLNLFKVCF